MISAYGYKLKRLRYGGMFPEFLSQVSSSYKLKDELIHDLQNHNLRSIIKNAIRYTPYYKHLGNCDDEELDSITVDSLSDYFKVLDKDTVRENQSDFINKSIPSSKLIYINTSGTTGTPLKVTASKEAIQHNYAYFTRLLAISGVSRNDKSATFAGRKIIPTAQVKTSYWRYNIFNNNLLLSSYHLSKHTLPSYINALERWNPSFIDSYPSAISLLAKYIVINNIKHTIRPTSIITSSETLLDEQRRIIEAAFECKVYDHYGCAEMAALITQCKNGNYHINSDYGIIELLDDNHRPVQTGEIGNLVCTGFINNAMPLIRYSIGDSGILSNENCDCGCNFPIMQVIVGRTDDLITTQDGRKIGRLDPIFKGLSGLKETQIIQTDINNITLKIVRDDAFSDDVLQKLIQELKIRIGKEFSVHVEFTERIPRSNSGKFKSVVSMVK
jgi:phenylacetate-CoA ligase